jgi:hypothetical protein
MALLLPFTISRYSQNTLTGPPVTDYIAWLNASDLVVNGTNVSNWKDEKNAWNIGSWSTIAATYNPSYRNNYAGISLNSTNPNPNQTVPTSSGRIDFRTSNSLTIMNAWIVDNTSSCRTLAGISTDGSTNNFLLWGQGMNAGSLPGTTVWLRTGNGSDVLTSGANVTLTVGALIVYTVTFTQTSSTTSTVTFSVNNAGTVTGNSTQFSSNVFYLTPVSEGYYSPASYNPNRSTNSTLLETIAWNRILNSTEQSNMYNYFLQKYSIPSFTTSGSSATVTLCNSTTGYSVTLFQTLSNTTTGGTPYTSQINTSSTVTFNYLPGGYYYYASLNGSSNYTTVAYVAPNPFSVAGTQLWLDANDTSVFAYSSGSNISNWTDKSSNAYTWTIPSGATGPTYTTDSASARCVSFASNALSAPVSIALGSSTFFVVLTVPTYYAGARGIFTASSSGQNDYVTGNGFSMDDNGYLEIAQNNVYNQSVYGVQTARVLAEFGWNGSAFTAWLNGSQSYTNTFGKGTSSIMALGARITSGAVQTTGQWGIFTLNEIVAYNTYLNSTNRGVIENYLMNKWIALVSLKAYTYSGSGSWLDSSPNGKNATLENGTAAKNSAGNGIVLNGSTNWTFSNVAAGGNWSFVIWYKNTGTPTGGGACVLTTLYTANNINMTLGYPKIDGVFCAGFWNNGNYTWYTGTGIVLTNNAWTHIAATWNGTTLSTYINGSLLGSTTPGGTSSDGGVAYRIGRRWDGTEYMIGEIGEVTIYKTALSSNIIAGAYNATRGIYGV